MAMTKEQVIESFATINENGDVTDFDFDSFDNLVKELVEARKNMRADAKEAKKAKKAEENEAKAEEGKKYYDSLNTGSEFKYVASDGTVVTAIKITTKSNSGLSAACEVVAGLEIKKSAKRYPKFYQLVVPTTAA